MRYGLALLLPLVVSCALAGIDAPRCEGDANCPSDSFCADGVCEPGERPAEGEGEDEPEPIPEGQLPGAASLVKITRVGGLAADQGGPVALHVDGALYQAGEVGQDPDIRVGDEAPLSIEIDEEFSGFIAAFSPTGAPRWAKVFGDPRFHGQGVQSLALSPDGTRLYVGGHARTYQPGTNDQVNLGGQYLAQLDAATGALNWFLPIASAEGGVYDLIATDDAVFALGAIEGQDIPLGARTISSRPGGFADAWLAEIDDSGDVRWARVISSGESDTFARLARAPGGALAVHIGAATFIEVDGESPTTLRRAETRPALVFFDAGGGYAGAFLDEDTDYIDEVATNRSDRYDPGGVAFTPDGGLLLCGRVNLFAGRFTDTLLTRVEPDREAFTTSIHRTGGCFGMRPLTSGDVLMLDSTHENSTPAYGAQTFVRAGDDYDPVLTRLSPSGLPLAATALGGADYDFPRSLAVAGGRVAISGDLTGPFGDDGPIFLNDAVALVLNLD